MNIKSEKFTRRDVLKAGGASALMIVGGAVLHTNEAWGMEPKVLKPETMKTLIQMARVIYPHDQLPDRSYAVAVKGYDDDSVKEMVEKGVAELNVIANQTHGRDFVHVGWEADQVELLKQVESGELFQKLRGGLITGIYGNQEVWPIFGYEGESFSKGGYINRGFDDIEWL